MWSESKAHESDRAENSWTIDINTNVKAPGVSEIDADACVVRSAIREILKEGGSLARMWSELDETSAKQLIDKCEGTEP